MSENNNRTILVRNLSEETVSQFEFFKNRNGLKTDSSAVVLMASKVEGYIKRIEQLENENYTLKQNLNKYTYILSEIKDSFNSVLNLDLKE